MFYEASLFNQDLNAYKSFSYMFREETSGVAADEVVPGGPPVEDRS